MVGSTHTYTRPTEEEEEEEEERAADKYLPSPTKVQIKSVNNISFVHSIPCKKNVNSLIINQSI